MKQIKVFGSLTDVLSVGWMRDDIRMVHVFGQARAGEPFQPSNGQGGPHWPCAVCEHHEYTREDFIRQMTALSKPMPQA